MGKDVRFPIKIDGLEGLDELVNGLKKVRAAADDANKAGTSQASMKSMMDRAQKANLRTQAAAVSIPGVYGAGGAEQYSGYKPTGSKGAGGGGMMDMLGMGGVAGAAVAGTLMLVKALKSVAGESKITNMFFGTLNKLLGLLIDVILLPFVPILVAVLMGLTYAIIMLLDVWPGLIEGLMGEGKPKTPLGQVIDFAQVAAAFGKFLFNDLPLMVVTGLAGILISVWNWLNELGWEIESKLIDATLAVLQSFYVEFVAWWTVAVQAVSDAWKSIVDFITLNVIDPLKAAFQPLADYITLNVVNPIRNAWSTLISDLTSWFSGIYENPFIKWLSNAMGGNQKADVIENRWPSFGGGGAGGRGDNNSQSNVVQNNTFNIGPAVEGVMDLVNRGLRMMGSVQNG